MLVDPNGGLRSDVLASICAAVADAKRAGGSVAIVSSGAIARGMEARGRTTRPQRAGELQALSALGQGRLFREYEIALEGHSFRAAQVLLTIMELHDRDKFVNARRTLQRLLSWEVVPIVNENDVIASDEITFGDNDFLAAHVATMIAADALILLTNTDGLFTADPHRGAGGELVADVEDVEEAVSRFGVGSNSSPLGSGGMLSKLRAGQIAAESGVKTTICCGLDADQVGRALRGELVGTTIHAKTRDATRHRSRHDFKKWLRHGKPSKGSVIVDTGAVRALEKSGASLLAVGVVDITGDFFPGDAIEIRNPVGLPVGKGIVNYSATELRRIKGKASIDVEMDLQEAPAQAVVNRDDLLLLTDDI